MITFLEFVTRLSTHIGTDQVLRFDRTWLSEGNYHCGFLLAATPDFVLIRMIGDDYALDGFTIFRTDTVGRYRVMTERHDLIHHSLRRLHGKDYLKKALRFPLASFTHIEQLPLLQQHFPLLTIRIEEIRDDACWIGTIAKMTPRCLYLDLIGTEGEWEGQRRFRYADITRIDVGARYEEALWAYSESVKGKR